MFSETAWRLSGSEPDHSSWQCKESHRCCHAPLAPRRWQWEILEHPPYSPDMSPCDYDLLAKMKEPLRGSRYNTRDERIRAIERSLGNINKGRCAYDVWSLPNLWQKEINKGATILKAHKCCTSVNKAKSETSDRLPLLFNPTFVYLNIYCLCNKIIFQFIGYI